MSRDIKFRAWDKQDQSMYQVQQLWFNPVRGFREEQGLYDKNDIVMQYTGLKDKNGVEIYEGDIVRSDQLQGLGFDVKGVVTYVANQRKYHVSNDEDSAWIPDVGWYLDTRPFQKHNGSETCIFHLNPEVLGNIYENPELLK